MARGQETNIGRITVDYLQQAKTFLQRAKDTKSVEEKAAHLEMAIKMLDKAIENQSSGGGSRSF